MNKAKIYEIRIHSRGGQGAKTMAQILAEATIEDGKFTQAFAEYGPERSGAPMQVFVRISQRPIRIHSNIKTPDAVIVADPSLIETVNILDGLKEGGVILVNTSKDKESMLSKLSQISESFSCYNLCIIDATKIAFEIFGKDIPSSVILGALAKLTNIVSKESLEEEIDEFFTRHKGKDIATKNVEAFRRGYEGI